MITIIGSILSALFGVLAGAVKCIEDGKIKPVGWFLFTMIVVVSTIMGTDAWLSGKTASDERNTILSDIRKQQALSLQVADANFDLTKSEIETRSLTEASITQITRYRGRIELLISQDKYPEARRELIRSNRLAIKLVQDRGFYSYSKVGFRLAGKMAERYLKRASESEEEKRKIELLSLSVSIWHQYIINNIRYAASKILADRLSKQVQELEALKTN